MQELRTREPCPGASDPLESPPSPQGSSQAWHCPPPGPAHPAEANFLPCRAHPELLLSLRACTSPTPRGAEITQINSVPKPACDSHHPPSPGAPSQQQRFYLKNTSSKCHQAALERAPLTAGLPSPVPAASQGSVALARAVPPSLCAQPHQQLPGKLSSPALESWKGTELICLALTHRNWVWCDLCGEGKEPLSRQCPLHEELPVQGSPGTAEPPV